MESVLPWKYAQCKSPCSFALAVEHDPDHPPTCSLFRADDLPFLSLPKYGLQQNASFLVCAVVAWPLRSSQALKPGFLPALESQVLRSTPQKALDFFVFESFKQLLSKDSQVSVRLLK